MSGGIAYDFSGRDVLVVGAGPVGLALGADLRARGVDVAIVERRGETDAGTRAIGIHSPSLAHLELSGATDALLARAVRIRRGEARADGRTLAAIRFDRLRARHRLSKFLLRQGRVYRDTKAWGVAHRQWLKAQRFAWAALQQTFEAYARTLDEAEVRLAALNQALQDLAGALQQQAAAQARDTLAELATQSRALNTAVAAQAQRTVDAVARQTETAAEAPRAAADVISALRGQLSDSLQRDHRRQRQQPEQDRADDADTSESSQADPLDPSLAPGEQNRNGDHG